MNVLVVGHAQIRDVNRDVYRALAKLGARVTLLVPDRWSSSYGALRVEPPRSPGVELVARPIAGRHHSNMYWYVGGIAGVARACRADVIFVDEDPAGFAALQAARIARRRGIGLVVLAVQNIFKRYPLPFEMIQRDVLGTAGAAVTNSSDATRTLRRRGFDGPFFEKPLTSDAQPLDRARRRAVRAHLGMSGPTFGFVGRLVREKGVDTFVDALARVPGVRGLIVGDGPERQELEALASRLRVGDRIRFTGALSPGDATDAIGALDGLVLPSRTMPNWSEQFGRVLVEAMASGTPVIAAASGAIPEVIGDAGILVPEDRPYDLARAMHRLLDESVAAAFVRRGRARHAERYSSAAAAAELIRAFRHTTNGVLPA